MPATAATFRLDAGSRRLSLSPRDPTFFGDPYPTYARLHAEAPVFFWEELGHWCVVSHRDVDRILRDRRFGRERPGGYRAHVAAGDRARLQDFDRVEASSLLELEPPDHTRLRTLVNRAFVSRQIERLRPRIEALAHRLVDSIEAKGRADLIADFATPLPATVIAEMMGVPPETGPQLVAWSNAMVRMYTPSPDAGTEDASNAAARDFAAFIRSHAALRRSGPATDDLLGVLVSAQADGGRLSEDELVSSAILILNAGHEATVHQTGNAIVTLLGQGGEPRRFFATPLDAAATVEECLRLDAPLHLFTRYAYESVEIAPGVALRLGDQVGLLLGAANRDPAAFVEPDSFLPARPDGKHVSFGAGIHFCIGAPLARLELQIALKVLFDRLPELRLTEEPRFRDSWHFHGLESLYARS